MPSNTVSRNAILNALFGKSTFPTITNLWLTLNTSDPTIGGSLAGEVPNTGNYARVPLAALLNTATLGTMANTTDIVFNVASLSWGTITHVGMVNTLTHGQGVMYLFGPLQTPAFVASGEAVRIAATNLSLTAT